MYGNTGVVARAIAEGIGPGAIAMSTAEATPAVVAAADLVVAGAPVHAMTLPSLKSRAKALASPIADGRVQANLDHPMMRDWLARLDHAQGSAAAFDTRVRGPFGRGAAPAIAAGLTDAGFTLVAAPRGFYVDSVTHDAHPGALVRPGELAEALEWGRTLVAEYALV